MERNNNQYSRFALCNEMFETVDIVRNFDFRKSESYVPIVKVKRKIFITGEGSSRIFPAKHFRYNLLKNIPEYTVDIDGAAQSMEYQLDNYVVFGVSNSGKTKELVSLFKNLRKEKHRSLYGLTATPYAIITELVQKYEILSCGTESAVAATKSVVEQALFFDSLYYNLTNCQLPNLELLSDFIDVALQIKIKPSLIEVLSKAPVIYFAGRNDGVAEELTLKANEITRKKSVFLEGTYALHGIEEVMNSDEVMIVVEPFEQEAQKFQEVLEKGAGITVIAISSKETIFPTIRIPDAGVFRNFVELAAGWNLLAETGIFMGIDLDKPVRARKIGNEVKI